MKTPSAEKGSIMVVVLMTFTVISMIVAGVLFNTMNSYRSVVQVTSWQEALLAAEAGADLGMNELRKSISAQSSSFSGWTLVSSNGTPVENPRSGPPLTGESRSYIAPTLNRGGEGNQNLDTMVTVDAPAQLVDTSGRQWFRIRATGTAYLTGGALINAADKRDHILRKLSFVKDRKTNLAVTAPKASRYIELIARPTAFEGALVAKGLVHLNDRRVNTDSFDSSDPAKSTNGNYPSGEPSKIQKNGDVATNGQIIEAGSAYVWGDCHTNAGVVTGAANVTGEQRTDFYQDLFPIKTPEWTSISPNPSPITSTNTINNQNVTLTAASGSTEANPTRYKLNSITLTGQHSVVIGPAVANGTGFVEIWVTGDITTSGLGEVVLQPGVKARFYVAGNMSVSGNGFINSGSSARAANLQVLGIQPPAGQVRTMSFAGNGAMTGVIYAPDHDVSLSGGGSSGAYVGSIVGKTVFMNGNSDIHYDEALSGDGYVTDYKVASWFEDNR
jgi:hypothetical protein